MSDRQHAMLSPSGLHRTLRCTRSALLAKKLPNTTSSYAEEGTLAHTLCERYVALLMGWLSSREFDVLYDEIKKHELYNPEMVEYCRGYALYVFSHYSKLVGLYGSSVRLEIEISVSLRKYIPESFGHLDCAIVYPGGLVIFDFKYGQGVFVKVENNYQIMAYGLGAYELFRHEYDIQTVDMHIYQPRMYNIASCTISVNALLHWAEVIVRPAALKAFDGTGDFVAGDHCKFCPAKPTCRTLTAYIKDITDGLDYELPELLKPAEVSKLLNVADTITDYFKSLKDHALKMSLKGKKFPGYKIVEGVSRRKIHNPDRLKKLLSYLYDDADYTTVDLKTLGELEALTGKADFISVSKGSVIKPKGAPTLVPDTDERTVFGSAADAFKHIVVD